MSGVKGRREEKGERKGFVRRVDVKKYLLLVICWMQLTTNYAFAHMPVGYALSLFQLSTQVNVLLGYRIFREKEIRKKFIGATIMIAGSVMIILAGEAISQ